MTQLPHRRWIYPAVLSLTLLVIIVAVALSSNTARASQETLVTLVPSGPAQVGESVTVKLFVENSHNLAGFQSSVSYDAALVKVGDVEVSADLERNGRDLLTLGPTGRDGVLVLGAATCPADCNSAEPWNDFKTEIGVDGRVELASLSFSSEVAGTYELKLENVKLVDPQGNLLVSGIANTVIEVR